MNYLRYFAAARLPVETCIVGTGGFGRSFLAQGRRVPMMRARISVDRDAEVAAEALRSVGVEPRRIRICATAQEAAVAWAAGDYIAAAGVAAVMDLPFEVLVEATAARKRALVIAGSPSKPDVMSRGCRRRWIASSERASAIWRARAGRYAGRWRPAITAHRPDHLGRSPRL